MTGWWHQPRPDDLYRVLGVGPDASRAEITRAYRLKARGAHPDAHPADPQAAARFRVLTSAYQVLSDPARRQDYDRRRGHALAPAPAAAAWPGPLRPPFPGGAPLWAGPTRVEPPAAPGQAAGAGREPDALTMLAGLLGLSPRSGGGWPGRGPGWPFGDQGWPPGDQGWPPGDQGWGWMW